MSGTVVAIEEYRKRSKIIPGGTMKKIFLIDDHLKQLADLLKQVADAAAKLMEAGYQFIPTMDPESDAAFIYPPRLVNFSYFLFG